MDAPLCPFCELAMEVKPMAGFEGQLRQFQCPICKSQLRQPLVVAPEPRAHPIKTKSSGAAHLECAECAFGDVNCANCDDTLCASHVRTVDAYARYLTPELGLRLTQRYGSRIYCPLCLQSMIERFTLEIQQGPPSKPKLLNWPLVLGLLMVFALILIGLKNCDEAASFKRGRIHEPAPTTQP